MTPARHLLERHGADLASVVVYTAYCAFLFAVAALFEKFVDAPARAALAKALKAPEPAAAVPAKGVALA